MKLFEIPMVVTSCVGLCFLASLDALPARADFTFGEPVDLGPRINHPVTDGFGQGFPCISPDGLELYFCRSVPGAGYDIFVARRPTVDSEWGEPVTLGPTVNSVTFDWSLSISADGLSLYYTYGGSSGYPWRLYVTKRATKDAPWGPPASVGGAMATVLAWGPSIAPNELELYFCSPGLGGYGGDDIWVTTRPTVNDPWGPPANLGPAVNSPYGDFDPVISPDGLLLFFDSRDDSDRWGTYMTRRATKSDRWGPRTYLGSILNPSGEIGTERPGGVSFDGSILYVFCSIQRTIWQVPILPVVDFNGDGKVDEKDLVLLVADWGKTNSVCDVGPFAWGDGVVDEKDLGVLMESLVTPRPNATDVACDAALSWISPAFAQTCDVYLGTSLEAVNNAGRIKPQGVLVSQGQTAATYDPPGLLELTKTYYWRVDFVITGPTPTIIRGPVLQFTTAALTYPIKNVTTRASSAQGTSGPERTVDGSGLDKNDGHSTDLKHMWLSLGVSPNWIQYEFDKVYALQEMWVWNFNTTAEPFIGLGAKTVKIEYSVDGTAWSALANVPEFAKAPGKAGYTPNTIVSFAAVPAKYVKLIIEKNWGVAPQTGLSEVRFFSIQSAVATKP
jgi:hypothetical protein